MGNEVFSPSATSSHARCPVKYHLDREWRPRVLGRREIAAFLGRGIGAGLGTYYNLKRAGVAFPDPESPAEIARTITQQSFLEAQELGATIQENEQESALSAPARAAHAILSYAKHDKAEKALPTSWKILDVEREFPQHGYARIDLGVDDGQGPAHVDWKSKGYLKGDFLPREIQRYDNHGQMLHYSWAYASAFPELGREFLPRYYVAFVILQPSFRVVVAPYTVTQDAHRVWLKASRQRWADMALERTGERVPPLAWEHSDNFGLCEYARACPVTSESYAWDPQMMEREFYRRPRKDEEDKA